MRTSNEDSFVANPDAGLFLVADGMGGHAAGEIASQLAASTIEGMLVREASPDANVPEILRLAAEEANQRVFEAQRQDRALSGMGSTLTVLFFRGEKYYIAHVGDSRAYRLRNGSLDQLTRDHSLVWHLYENGVLRKTDLSTHPQKNLITRSVGSHPQVEIDLEQGEACEGDIFLLCSDGLTDGVTDDGIRGILNARLSQPQQMADLLVDAANLAGGPDNITVVVVRIAANNTTAGAEGKPGPP
ncbi:MAG: Stp1/IreP family PP2C-type Ser/Thr phosphatase [Acidobacteria bacterium]|nr:Stp1/IreP family PP2C-type Ser/Thr phosphatase [Acidobacteriota bacterium]